MQLSYILIAIIEGEVTKSRNDLNLVTASISSSIQDVRELHALSPPSVGRYTLDCMYACTYVCMYCMYVCMYICVCMYVRMYVQVWTCT